MRMGNSSDNDYIEESSFADDAGQFGSNEDGSDDEESLGEDDSFLQRLRNNDLRSWNGVVDFALTNKKWKQIGRAISNNTHLEDLRLVCRALNDDKISFLFKGLTRSSSIKQLWLGSNGFSAAGVRSMIPFLQNASNLRRLYLSHNNIRSEGFNTLLRELRDSPIEWLCCIECGIETIHSDIDDFPKKLEMLNLSGNNINTDGYRQLSKLLQREDATITELRLENSKIDDEGVAILADSLRSNTSLQRLFLTRNSDITTKGLVMLLKLVNDISSISATLQSNHTLKRIYVSKYNPAEPSDAEEEEIKQRINMATRINDENNLKAIAGREKVIKMQLHSARRDALTKLQGVSRSLYSDIDPLHLPEVLSLVGQRHGQGELFAALKSSIAGVISTLHSE